MAPLFDNILKRLSGTSDEGRVDDLSLEYAPESYDEEFSEDLMLEEDTEMFRGGGGPERPPEPETPPEPERAPERRKRTSKGQGSGRRTMQSDVEQGTGVKKLEDQIDQMSSRISKLEREKKEIQDDVSRFDERVEKLFKVYEILFRGLNPYDEGVPEVDEDLLGEDVFEVFKEFVGGEGAAVHPKLKDLEGRINDLEDAISSGKFAKKKAEKDLESEYERALQETEGTEETEEGTEEMILKPKWKVGEKVLSPEEKVVEIVNISWDSSHEEWIYKCKPLEEGGQ